MRRRLRATAPRRWWRWVLEMGFGLPDVAGATPAAHPQALCMSMCMSSLHTGPLGIGSGECRGLLTCAGRAERLLMWARMVDGDRAWRGMGTLSAHWTGATVGSGEGDGDHFAGLRVPSNIRGSPASAQVPLGTDGTLRLPVDVEVVAFESLQRACLPTEVAAGGAEHIHPKARLALSQHRRILEFATSVYIDPYAAEQRRTAMNNSVHCRSNFPDLG